MPTRKSALLSGVKHKFVDHRSKLDAFWGLADQALLSASNFLMMLLLARHLGVNQFGTFVIVFAAIIFANGIQGDLFTQPYMVLSAANSESENRLYTTSIGIAQLLFSMVLALVFASVGYVLNRSGESAIGSELLAISPLAVSWQSQEFIRRILYSRSNYRMAFFLDSVAYGGQILAVLILWRLDRIESTTILLAMSLTFAVSAIWGAILVRTSFTLIPDLRTMRSHLRLNWRFGKWLMGGTIAYWLSSQLFSVLAAGFVSVGAAGGIRMAQNLVAPTNILTRTTDTIGTPRAARVLHIEGSRELLPFIRRLGTPGLFAMVGFLLPAAVLAKPIISMLAGPEYAPYAWLVSVLAVVYLLEYMATIASIAIKSLGDTAAFMIANSTSAALVMTIGTWAVWQFGLAGAAAGMVIHSLIVNLILWSRIRARTSHVSVLHEELAQV